MDQVSFLAREAVVLCLVRLDPIKNQSIDVEKLASVRADMLQMLVLLRSFEHLLFYHL